MVKKFFPVVTGLVLVGAGIAAVRFGKPGAALYGLPTENKEALGFARAAGARDIALGVILLALPFQGRSILLASTIVSIVDFLNVLLTSDDPPFLSLSIHASGIAALLLFAAFTPKYKSFSR